jgi:PEP-CTERM motif
LESRICHEIQLGNESVEEEFAMKALRCLISVAALAALSLPLAAHATATVDPTGDFLTGYAGPKTGDYDVVSVEAFFNGNTSMFTFIGTMAAPIVPTSGARYVWGVNRGAGTVGFPTLAPGVLFDRAFSANANGTGAIGATPFTVTVSGNKITAFVPLSLLPSTGFNPYQYTANLWPRSPGNGLTFISDFAPNNSNIAIAPVPEPATWGMMLLGFVGIGAMLRGRRRAVAANA